MALNVGGSSPLTHPKHKSKAERKLGVPVNGWQSSPKPKQARKVSAREKEVSRYVRPQGSCSVLSQEESGQPRHNSMRLQSPGRRGGDSIANCNWTFSASEPLQSLRPSVESLGIGPTAISRETHAILGSCRLTFAAPAVNARRKEEGGNARCQCPNGPREARSTPSRLLFSPRTVCGLSSRWSGLFREPSSGPS